MSVPSAAPHPREVIRRFSEASELSTLLRSQLDAAYRPDVQSCILIADLPEELSRHRGFDILIADQRLRLVVTYSRLADGCRALRCVCVDDVTGEQSEVPSIEFDDWHSFRLSPDSTPLTLRDGSSAIRLLMHLMRAAGL